MSWSASEWYEPWRQNLDEPGRGRVMKRGNVKPIFHQNAKTLVLGPRVGPPNASVSLYQYQVGLQISNAVFGGIWAGGGWEWIIMNYVCFEKDDTEIYI